MHLFDLRAPLGWLFLILGGLLVVSGWNPPATSDGVSLGLNINLIWGVVLVVFVIICLGLSRRRRAKQPTRLPRLK